MIWVAAPILAALLAFIELRRRAPRRVLRASLAALAALALGAIGVRPAVTRPVRGGAALVLAAASTDVTAGDAAAQARRIADSLGGAPVVLRDTIPDLAWLRRRLAPFDTLHVAGGGLDRADRRAAAGLAVAVHAGRPAGVIHAAWTRAVPLSSPVIVSGRVAGAGRPWVRLYDAGDTVDSTRADAGGRFTLRAVPRAAGRYAYVLQVGGGAGSGDTVAVHVREPRPPRVLIVEAAPSFETRHLKTLVASQGAEVAVRSDLGRGVYRREYLNRPEIPLRRLDLETLRSFDVLVADAAALTALAPAERRAIDAAVADSGLGLVVRADPAVLGPGRSLDPSLLAARPVPTGGAPQRDARLRWISAAGTEFEASAVPVAAFTLELGLGTDVLARDDRGRAVAAARPRGAGRTVITLVRQPGRWLLAGERRTFADYWAVLLAQAAAGARVPEWNLAAEGPIVVDEATELLLTHGDTSDVPVVTGPHGVVDTVAAVADQLDPARRRAAYWPRTAGWHRMTGGGATIDFHVSAKGDWRAARAAARVAATRRDALWAPETTEAADAQPARARPLPMLPFLLVFLTAAGLLWVADRRPSIRATPYR